MANEKEIGTRFSSILGLAWDFLLKTPYFFHKSWANDASRPLRCWLKIHWSQVKRKVFVRIRFSLFSIHNDKILCIITLGHSTIYYTVKFVKNSFLFFTHFVGTAFILMRFDTIFTFCDNEVMHQDHWNDSIDIKKSEKFVHIWVCILHKSKMHTTRSMYKRSNLSIKC